MTRRVTVRVTEADIERAHRDDSYTCVVAQAIARTVPDATNIEVDTQSIRFTSGGDRLVYFTPYAVQGYVIAFDAGDRIEPFSFQLRDPVLARRRRRTAAGAAADRAARQARRGLATPSSGPIAATPSSGPTPREAAQAAYAEARAQLPGQTRTSAGGRKAPPRVFKTKRRSYGHRLLRINQDRA